MRQVRRAPNSKNVFLPSHPSSEVPKSRETPLRPRRENPFSAPMPLVPLKGPESLVRRGPNESPFQRLVGVMSEKGNCGYTQSQVGGKRLVSNWSGCACANLPRLSSVDFPPRTIKKPRRSDPRRGFWLPVGVYRTAIFRLPASRNPRWELFRPRGLRCNKAAPWHR